MRCLLWRRLLVLIFCGSVAVTEDYSSYESVDEDAPDAEPERPKAKRKSTTTAKPKKDTKSEKVESKSTVKPETKPLSPEGSRSNNVKTGNDNGAKGRKLVGSTRGSKSQGSIMNFFGTK